MKFNQKGFAHSVILLLILVLAGTGGAGYLVYKKQNDKKEAGQSVKSINSFEECVAAGNPVAESYPEQCSTNGQTFTKRLSSVEKKKINSETADWTTYSGLGLSFSYPKNWTQDKSRPDDPKAWAHFVSSDYKEATEMGPSVKAGYWLEIFVFDAGEDPSIYKSLDEHLASLKNSDDACGGNYKTSNVDSLPVIISDMKCHGSYLTATVYKNNKEYDFRLNSLDEDNPEVRKLFNNILSTVVLD